MIQPTDAVVYLTIWLALTLFAAGEWGRRGTPHRVGWPWTLSTAGLTLAIVHTLLAFGIVHGWSHADAVTNTARQTQAVFGVPFGAGVYLNYLFFLVWAVDLADWRRRGGVRGRSARTATALQVFYLVIIVNAAVVFAAPSRRIAGLSLVLVLLAAWRRPARTPVRRR